jgi:endonuclease/exonuclease/phosphatase family metal-dependent hydrolase
MVMRGALEVLNAMRIMTFNLRFDTERDGKNAWVHRRELAVEVIRHGAPDILGTQEGMERQLLFLQENLPAYRMQAHGRYWDATCQYPTLFVREERFRIVEGGDCWLSQTPHVHRSKDWDSAFPRMMNHALLEDRHNGRQLLAVVTHLDHIGVQARVEQAKRIATWLSERRGPRILMGDFNDAPGSSVHRILASEESALADTWQLLSGEESETSMTHHDFAGHPEKCRMDWVLVSDHLQALNAVIVSTHLGGRYPSDHFPYLVELAWRQPQPERW